MRGDRARALRLRKQPSTHVCPKGVRTAEDEVLGVASFPKYSPTQEELRRYHEDGVVVLRDALESNWLRLIEIGIEEARANMSLTGRFMSRKVQGYGMDLFLWKRIDALRDLVYYGPFARLAQTFMRSHEVRFFYDQMFVKEAGTDVPTPWHQDLSFWPIRGEQICSFWIPLDPVDVQSSGLLYVKGSHKWARRFKAISPDYVAAVIDDSMEDVPDINADPSKYELLSWDMEPGDMLAFHPLTLHGSYGNMSRTRRRRALALRFTGDDVVYSPSPKRMPIHYRHASVPLGPLRGAAFPRILPEPDPSERLARRFVESEMPLKVLHSLWNNTLAAVRVHRRGTRSEVLRQTWGSPGARSDR